MTSRACLKSVLVAGTALGALVAQRAVAQEVSSPANPQNPSEAQVKSGTAAPAAGESSKTIIITGSRIRRPNLESQAPITSIGGEEFFEQGKTSIGEVLNELPSLRSTVTQANSTRMPEATGINELDLRGLGTNRTLVLENGRRLPPGNPFGSAVDVNIIPTDLIERVDIVTGGSSAVYGSDAIAGVVNFILKRDFDGFQVRGQKGISSKGDAGQLYFSTLAGKNFADGRGNVAFNFEFAHQDAWYASDRPAYAKLAHYLQVDFDDPGAPNGSDGIPDNVLFRDLRYPFVSNGGTFVDFNTFDATGNFPSYIFTPNGTLVPQTGERIGSLNAPVDFFTGGNGSNLVEGKELGYAPDLKRYSFNLLAHFTVSDAFEPFLEAKYVRANSFGSSLGAFFSLDESFWGPREVYRTDNPYLTDQARDLIRSTMGLAPGEESIFFYGRNFNDLGPVQDNIRRSTFRIVPGIRGKLGSNWSYEASLNFARVSSHDRISGNVDVQRYLLAIDAVRDPATGKIVCRSQIDPSAAVAYEGVADPAYAQAQLANDVAQCQPLNPFGEGNVSQAARDYILTDASVDSRITQRVFNAYITGDTGQWFNLPGGPIGMVAGVEARHETFRDVQDQLLASGITFSTPAPPFEPPAFDVKELYGELRVPLLAKRRFFDELTVNAAGRVADYRGKIGTVTAWNAGVEWQPFRDIRFRINESKAVRAPNLVESFQPLGQSFDNSGLISDPCSSESIGAGSPNRVANCAAAGVPNGFAINYISSFPYLSGGNPDLKAETSRSFTAGTVIQPRVFPGLGLSVDYYNIKVSDVITTPGIQAILNSCYDAATIQNQFCSLFQRNTTGTTLPTGEIPGQIIINSLHLVPVNYAALKVRGIDVELTYRHTITGLGALNTRLLFNHVIQNDSFLNPDDPTRADQNLLELGNPQNRFNWDVSLRRGAVTFGYRMRYIGKMAPGAIENILSVQGRPPEDADAYPFRFFKPAWYHDVRLGFDTSRFSFYTGIDNLTDRLPPPGINGLVDQGGLYDNVGRFFYAGAVARF